MIGVTLMIMAIGGIFYPPLGIVVIVLFVISGFGVKTGSSK